MRFRCSGNGCPIRGPLYIGSGSFVGAGRPCPADCRVDPNKTHTGPCRLPACPSQVLCVPAHNTQYRGYMTPPPAVPTFGSSTAPDSCPCLSSPYMPRSPSRVCTRPIFASFAVFEQRTWHPAGQLTCGSNFESTEGTLNLQVSHMICLATCDYWYLVVHRPTAYR